MKRYALRFADGTVEVMTVDLDMVVARFEARGERDVFVFGFSPDGRYLATTHFPGQALTVWDVENDGNLLQPPAPRRAPRSGVYEMARGSATCRSTNARGHLQSRRQTFDDDRWPCRLWAADTWLEERQIGATGLCFSPDGRSACPGFRQGDSPPRDNTGRNVARLESPELCT